MSRIYNDLGSLTRDLAEQNVNCANFLCGRSDDDGAHTAEQLISPASEGTVKEKSQSVRFQQAKARLEELAAYERDAAHLAGAKLIRALLGDDRTTSGCGGSQEWVPGHGSRTRRTDAVNLFLGVAELYADIYVVRDLSNKQQDGRDLGGSMKRKRGYVCDGEEEERRNGQGRMGGGLHAQQALL